MNFPLFDIGLVTCIILTIFKIVASEHFFIILLGRLKIKILTQSEHSYKYTQGHGKQNSRLQTKSSVLYIFVSYSQMEDLKLVRRFVYRYLVTIPNLGSLVGAFERLCQPSLVSCPLQVKELLVSQVFCSHFTSRYKSPRGQLIFSHPLGDSFKGFYSGILKQCISSFQWRLVSTRFSGTSIVRNFCFFNLKYL